MDDTTLVRRAAEGDEDAFELLVRRRTDEVWRVARGMLRDDHAAEEAVQDTFLKAYRSLAGFRGDASVRTWLLQICRRTCLDRIRAPRAEVVPLDRARELRAHHPQPELRLALAEALTLLSPEEREAFVLVDVLGYSREEAAAVCAVPSSTMRSRVTRARGRLAAALRGPDGRSEVSGR